MNASAPPQTDRTGLAAAFSAYVIWGFLPLYLILVRSVPAFEFVGWRIIWTLPLCLLIVLARRQGPDLRAALANRRTLGLLALSATLIAVNWVVYVWAIQNGQVYAASLGYYINPLVNVLLGTVLLGEKLSRPQWAAVGLAGIGVSLLAAGALTTLWISLTLALSFGSYGLIRKQLDVGSVPGLTIESALLLLPSLAVAWYYAQTQGSSFAVSTELSVAIMAGGVVTAFPLLLFAIAARKLPYSMLGFIQFLAPSIVFVLGLTVFGEELKPVQAACFACIWAAAAIFVWDLVARTRKPAAS
ncbi:MAG: EamA family transporter RarD [Qipengyuania citrea]|jgi:chloramphenicol-sensitive protein RarD|uniref:Membrane protein n=1 Tax=Qipengyuania citrea LAMA 915 TaxID=1306953 RepID=A0A0L1KGN5_9SPHN|nr:EamA family transporter RarD [Qipengyuania citrea]KNH03240.1 membrane protein [Qipengyuania citrea LAMA 915]MCD1591429.1 EamA family transporter RarD [Qipengyuania citrea]MCZ4266081.1 EamA family transporter RarD [Erythrobacter sp. G21629-S1]